MTYLADFGGGIGFFQPFSPGRSVEFKYCAVTCRVLEVSEDFFPDGGKSFQGCVGFGGEEADEVEVADYWGAELKH